MGDCFLHNFSVSRPSKSVWDRVNEEFLQLLTNYLKTPSDLMPLGSGEPANSGLGPSCFNAFEDATLELKVFEVNCSPSSLSAYAVARETVIKYRERLKVLQDDTKISRDEKLSPVGSNGEVPVSKLLQIGLHCLCELMTDVSQREPEVCRSALKALDHLLASQKPEEMAFESKSLTDRLYSLLSQIRTAGNPQLSALANSCLISLAVGYGLPEYILKTAAQLIFDANGETTIRPPPNFVSLYNWAFNRGCEDNNISSGPTWLSVTVDSAHSVAKVSLPPSSGKMPAAPQSGKKFGAIASDGQNLYVINDCGVSKIGSGFNRSRRGFLLKISTSFKASMPVWLGVTGGRLLLRPNSLTKIWSASAENFEFTGDYQLEESVADGVLCSDGSNLYRIAQTDSFSLRISTLDDQLRELETEEPLVVSLKQTKTTLFGDHPTLTLPEAMATLKPGLEEQIVDIKLGGRLGTLLTARGKVFYIGAGHLFDMPDSFEKWTELPMTDKIMSISVGHNGSHILMLTATGSLLFFGTPYRGEDGETRKLKKQPTPVRNKQIPTVDGKKVVSFSASNGTTAFITEKGRLFLHGKDMANCDLITGEVLGLEGVQMYQVALGKAHCVALTKRGQLYTFGMNNFGQCGRADLSLARDSDTESSRTTDEDVTLDLLTPNVCSYGQHKWVKEELNRCHICSHQQSGPSSTSSSVKSSPASKPSPAHITFCTTCHLCQKCAYRVTKKRQDLQDQMEKESEADSSGRTNLILPPAIVPIRGLGEGKIVQVSVGYYHTLALSQQGKVFAFGSNRHGQLGLGHLKSVVNPELVSIPATVCQVACGNGHSLCRTTDGRLFSFGKFNNGQLIRHGRETNWFSIPGLVEGLDQQRVTWVSASGDCTVVTCECPLLSGNLLRSASATANRHFFMLFPRANNYVVIHRQSGKVKTFKAEHLSLTANVFTLDPLYDVLWCYDIENRKITGLSPTSNTLLDETTLFLANPEFAIPSVQQVELSTSHLATTLLASYYLLHQKRNRSIKQSSPSYMADLSPTSAYFTVTRFQNYGGGWGYSQQSVEAIQFSSDRDILLVGYGLYGGRGEYSARMKLYRISRYDPEEEKTELLDETDEIQFESQAQERSHLFLTRPILCKAREWLIAWVSVNGPSSDCGAGGQPIVAGEDGTVFSFRNSRMSNNGTDVTSGQIPSLLYKPSPESNAESVGKLPIGSSVQSATNDLNLSCRFFNAVTPSCFASLLKIVITAVEENLRIIRTTGDTWLLERNESAGIMALELLEKYIKLVCPANGPGSEDREILACIEESFQILCTVLHYGSIEDFEKNCHHLLEVCSSTFVSCFHVFFPDSGLLQEFTVDLLKFKDGSRNSWLLQSSLLALEATDYPVSYLASENRDGLFPPLTTFLKAVRGGVGGKPLEFRSLLQSLIEVIFGETGKVGSRWGPDILSAGFQLLAKITEELVTTSSLQSENPPLMQTGCRFSRLSLTMSWDTGLGAPDAIAFHVDSPCVTVHGVGAYLGTGSYTYTLELLVNRAADVSCDQWQVVEKSSGTVTASDLPGDYGFIKLSKPTRLLEAVQYAFRLQLQGNRTWSGESGVPSVMGVNGCKFTFLSSSLSLNGTNVIRGQIPVILYSITDHLKSHRISAELASKWFLETLKTLTTRLQQFFSTLLYNPTVLVHQKKLGHVAHFVSKVMGFTIAFLNQRPGGVLEILSLMDELLPLVTSLTVQKQRLSEGKIGLTCAQVVVESAHPYKSATVQSHCVRFTDDVKYVSVEFDGRCSSAQVEDSFQLYLETTGGAQVPVGRFWGSQNWPKNVLLLPGNCVWLLFESASNYSRAEEQLNFGFKCQVTGFAGMPAEPLVQLEREFAYLYSYGCSILMQQSSRLQQSLTLSNEFGSLDEEAGEMLKTHGQLLKKGLALYHIPTPKEIVGGKLPLQDRSPEILFLKDFISGAQNTSGGKLARWIMPESIVEPNNCDLQVDCHSRPIVITVLTKDQYGRIAYAPGISVDINITAAPTEQGRSKGTSTTAQGLPASLQLETPYQATYLNKARYVCITMMKAFRQHSFEELRLSFAAGATVKDSLQTSSNEDGSFVAKWMPRQSGQFRIEATVDGYPMGKSQMFEIQDGHVVCQPLSKRLSHLSRSKMATVKDGMTRGIRLRVAPSLLAKEVGVIGRSAAIVYIEELKNGDGVWLKLSEESALHYCQGHGKLNPTSVWCLQYNRHLDRILIECDAGPIEDLEEESADRAAFIHSVIVACDERYVVTNAGSAGVEIHSHPQKSASVVGVVLPHEEIHSIGWIQNSDAIWVQLHRSTLDKVVTTPGIEDGFSVAQELNGAVFLERLRSQDASLLTPSRTYANGNSDQFNSRSSDVDGEISVGNQRQVGTQTFKNSASNHPSTSGSLLRQKNGNVKEPHKTVIRIPPQNSVANKLCAIQAVSPSFADCVRSVFAAFVWHESLAHDTMASASYLKFHPELQCAELARQLVVDSNSSESVEESGLCYPATLYLLYTLWREIYTAVQAVVDKHLILPSPPMTLKTPCTDKQPTVRHRDESFCELCEQWQPSPVTFHMRAAHKGCGLVSGGQGYNSLGKYTSGWTGNCGDGGCGSSTWYLLCSRCRQNYLQSTESSKERQRKEKAREFRSSSGNVDPTKILKNNAEFLLSLNSRDTGRVSETFKEANCGWNINLFPSGSPTGGGNHSGPGTSLSSGNGKSGGGGDSDYNLLNGNELGGHIAHASDPGPKRNRMDSEASLPSSEPLYPMCISATSKEKSSAPGVCDSQLLICSPSVALKSLATEARRATFNSTLKRPVVAFVIQHHNLPRVREAMQLAIVRSTAYSHAFQVLVWLLHQVSSQQSVEDILWCSIRGLSGSAGNSGASSRRHWTFCLLSGPVCQQMLEKFNQFLYSVVTIMRSGSVTLELQEKCLKCWLLGFLPFDHSLILKSHILQVIHRVMSDSGGLHSNLKGIPISSPDVELLEDITSAAQLDVSSRKAMVGCLTDLSTETFWESGEEDRGGPKMITLKVSLDQVRPVMVGVHIDNTRDPRISSLTAHILVNNSRHRLFSRKVDGRFVGWAKFLLSYPVVHIELRSLDPVIRVRQVVVLGSWKNRPLKPIQQSPSYLLQFNTVQAEAFKLFQLIAANAFNEAFTVSEDSSIRDQIVEILFSKDQLNSLQAYVGSQITSALEKEILQLRDNLKRNTSYCYGLISLLEKLCSSNYGIRTILNRTSTLVSLSQLLVFSYAAMQAKVVDVLKMIVGAFDPATLDSTRFLENFFKAIAKALTLQVREKTSRQLTTASVETNFPTSHSSWHVTKPVSTQVATQTVDFLVDMAYEKYGRSWGDLLKETLATHLLSLASLPDDQRQNPAVCLQSGRFWLCVASLCVLRDDSWLAYSPLWRNLLAEQTELGGLRPLCDNHDDNTTVANVWCEDCRMHLCRECGAVLHLNKRCRQHRVEQLSVADNKLTVNVNESCGRLKLSWILLSIDSSTMNGMAEFRSETAATLKRATGECRFCGNDTGSELVDVCSHPDCQHYSVTACRKSHSCGHQCNGIVDEAVCLPCLKCHTDDSLKQDADDMCVICFTDTLVSAPSIQLACGHVFHSHCVRTVLARRWPGPRINFSFLLCPICKADLDHPAFWPLLAPLRELRNDVSKKALTRLDYEGLSSCKGLSSPSSPYYQNPGKLALDKFAYYICNQCQKPYFGGEVQCDPSDNFDFDPAELLCGGCSDVAQAQVCPKHGTDYLEYKCRYCCSVAVFFCFGTTHFCAHCHEDFQRIVALPKHQLPPCPVGPKATQLEGKSCPLRVKHPATGEEFALGCGICRNVQTF